MMCQEVIDLMQRYLDQDLDETEYNAMLRHLQQCDECTELFQRLVSLSHELEQLPKVTPSYSLVDAIMPRLDRIDAGAPSIEPPAVLEASAPAAAAPAFERNVPQTPPSVSADNRWRQRMRGLISPRWLGGVVAAGLVLGFFVFEQQQKHTDMTNADGLLATSPQSGSAQKSSRSDNSAADSAGGASPAGSYELKRSEVTAPEAKEPPAGISGAGDSLKAPAMAGASQPGNTAGGAAAKKKPAADAGSTAPAAPEGAAANPDPVSGGGESQADTATQQQSPQEPSAGSQAAEPNSPAAQGPVLNEQQRIQLAQPPLDASKEADNAAGSNAASAQDASDIQPKMQLMNPNQGFAAAGGASEPQAKQPDGGSGAMYGIAAAPPPETFAAKVQPLASPDGAYSAVISEDRHVVISDRQGKKVFASHEWSAAAKVTLGSWTADNKLSYRITENNVTTTYVIDAVKATETRQQG